MDCIEVRVQLAGMVQIALKIRLKLLVLLYYSNLILIIKKLLDFLDLFLLRLHELALAPFPLLSVADDT